MLLSVVKTFKLMRMKSLSFWKAISIESLKRTIWECYLNQFCQEMTANLSYKVFQPNDLTKSMMCQACTTMLAAKGTQVKPASTYTQFCKTFFRSTHRKY